MALQLPLARTAPAPRTRAVRRREVVPTPEEARLLTLAPSWVTHGATSRVAAPAVRPHEDAPAQAGDHARQRVSLLEIAGAAVVPGLVLLFLAAAYVIEGGGSTTPLTLDSASGFAASATGPGRIMVPVSDEAFALRIAVEPASGATGPGFWCFDRVGVTAPAARYCEAIEPRDALAGVTTEHIVRLPSDAAASEAYAVDLYCEQECAWRVETEARTAEPASATAP